MAPSFYEWLEWAENAAYGVLGLKPDEFYHLSPMELMKLLVGYEQRRMNRLWLASYFTANLMGAQIRNISPEKLMQPFLPKKTKEEKVREREDFFTSFYAERKEEERWQP